MLVHTYVCTLLWYRTLFYVCTDSPLMCSHGYTTQNYMYINTSWHPLPRFLLLFLQSLIILVCLFFAYFLLMSACSFNWNVTVLYLNNTITYSAAYFNKINYYDRRKFDSWLFMHLFYSVILIIYFLKMHRKIFYTLWRLLFIIVDCDIVWLFDNENLSLLYISHDHADNII